MKKQTRRLAALAAALVLVSLLAWGLLRSDGRAPEAEEAQRIIDTLIGACYAINATIKKAAAQTYLLAPETVEVAGTYADDNRSSTIFEDGRN